MNRGVSERKVEGCSTLVGRIMGWVNKIWLSGWTTKEKGTYRPSVATEAAAFNVKIVMYDQMRYHM